MYQNYHKHTSYSNIWGNFKDSVAVVGNYLDCMRDRYGDKPCIYSTVEHGYQSSYFKIYNQIEAYNKKHGTNIKFVFGTEAYWVRDRKEKDNTNCHIILLARNNNGRLAINKALSIANKTGYYYRPRLDLDLLLSLPSEDVFVTTACAKYWCYQEIEEITKTLNDHFKYFYLEIQAHNTQKNIELNRKILRLSKKYNIPLIAGCDSHYIDDTQDNEREYLLKSSKEKYDDGEEGWYMDYPTKEILFERFQELNIFTDEEINDAIERTNDILDFEDIILNRDLKIPVIKTLRSKNQEERNKKFVDILRREWKKQKWDINEEKQQEYIDEIKKDIDEIIKCNMADYFILSYYIMKNAQEKYGGTLTLTGRGSAPSMYINKLLNLTNIDRINAPVIMYPERFLSASRIIDSHTMPDIDNNIVSREPYIQAQKDLIGEEGTSDLVAFGTLKLKSAWKMYARANNVDVDTANEISKALSKYDKALSYAESDDEVWLEEYVPKEYLSLVEESKKYTGIIDGIKAHACACCCTSVDIAEEIGLIKCRSESTGNEVICALIESDTIDSFGYLKQDYLIVKSISLIFDTYKELGMKPLTINQLLDIIKNDEETWDIYEKGLTAGVNQVEQPKSREKVMKYKPKNISELTQFIAAIRPSFQTMYQTFENREKFEYGIKAFDGLLQDEYCKSSFILYQESLMKVLGFAGFPMSETYTLIKAISKKKEYVIKETKPKFIEAFSNKLIETGEVDNMDRAKSLSDNVWEIINNSAKYGFNCVSGDTVIYRRTGAKGHWYTVGDMWNLKHYPEVADVDKSQARAWRRTKFLRKWGKAYSLSPNKHNAIEINDIRHIYYMGKQETYTVTTELGMSIRCTKDHSFPTANGKFMLSELKVGDELYCYPFPKRGFTLDVVSNVKTDKIKSIEYYGVEDVYDVEMSPSVSSTFMIDNGLIVSNCSHSYCMALDSANIAYLKAHFPMAFYKTALNIYNDEKDKNKVAMFQEEMIERGYKIAPIKFRQDNRKFEIIDENTMSNAVTSIKNMPSNVGEILFKLGQQEYVDRFELYMALYRSKLNAIAIDILFHINYFSEFGNVNQLLWEYSIFKKYINRKQFRKKELSEIESEAMLFVPRTETEATIKDFDNLQFIRKLVAKYPEICYNIVEQIRDEIVYLGHSALNDPSYDPEVYCVSDVVSDKYGKTFLKLNHINTGYVVKYRVDAKYWEKHQCKIGDLVNILLSTKNINKKIDGKWVKTEDVEHFIKVFSVIQEGFDNEV